MASVLGILLQNIASTRSSNSPLLLHVIDLVKLQQVDKLCCERSKDILAYWTEHYDQQPFFTKGKMLSTDAGKSGNCAKCNRTHTTMLQPFSQTYMCITCQQNNNDRIFKTECKKEFKFNDEDLNKLDHCCKWVAKYRCDITYYLRKDVQALAVLKYGSLENIPGNTTRSNRNQAYERRKAQLTRALDKIVTTDEKKELLRKLQISQDFLKNGEGGIRKLSAALGCYDEYMSFVRDQLPCPLSENMIMSYLKNFAHNPKSVKGILMQESTIKMAQDKRKQDLIQALTEHELDLRNDSRICQLYIDRDVGTLNDVVRTMRQMNFLHAHTEYPNIVRGMLNRAYNSARTDIKYNYGYISDPDQYDEIMDEYVDRERIVQDAKVKAVRSFCKMKVKGGGIRELPEFMTEFVGSK
jgi:hypothetical protein